jgi:HD-like signal output (HDOD) protein
MRTLYEQVEIDGDSSKGSKMICRDMRDVVLRAADRMPVLPHTFQRALALFAAEGDEVSVAKLSAVIEQDAVMTGNLVAIANSVLYGRIGTVCSLRQAIARIGVHKTRNALLGFSVLRSFRTIHLPPTWSLARFNDHALASAIFSDLLVQKVKTKDAEWAFLGGLLHDIGLLLIATGLPEEAREISKAESDYQMVERERQVLGFSHFEIGVALLSRWGCPVVVQDASLFCQSNTFQYQSPLSLGMAVKTASLLADMSGMSLFGPKRDEDGAFLLDAISIPKPAAFIDAFQAEYGGLSEFARN